MHYLLIEHTGMLQFKMKAAMRLLVSQEVGNFLEQFSDNQLLFPMHHGELASASRLTAAFCLDHAVHVGTHCNAPCISPREPSAILPGVSLPLQIKIS
jgi:hypothetical protein